MFIILYEYSTRTFYFLELLNKDAYFGKVFIGAIIYIIFFIRIVFLLELISFIMCDIFIKYVLI